MDVEIFKKVFLPYHQKLYRIAYRIIQNESSAEDIVQETYTKLWDKRNDLDNIENTEVFAVVILRNQCLDHLRKTKKNRQTSYDYDIPETESLTKQIELQDEVHHIRQLVDNLPEQQRQVMILKHWDSCTDEEIEQITGLSSGNIRVTLSRARKTIREQFKQLNRYEN
ncbi:RNA polymerase sigma factor [Dysgonomonas sp. ZJ279]|uniref:RNA polymerase sigma factor n=1 Tax=Dysgonomonas sp. ZJ279 TaxID=2709796 RepID=UPI0013E9D89B|nr:RNA polymerase sigma factor [Dysgonomonas sp. ZJ279]